MTVLTGKLESIGGRPWGGPGHSVAIFSRETRAGAAGIVILELRDRIPMPRSKNGQFISEDMEPGPIRVELEGGELQGKAWDLTLPEGETSSLDSLIEDQTEWSPPVVSAAVAAKNAAEEAALAAWEAVDTPGRKGDQGEQGDAPRIQDGTWWVGDTDTGVPATGEDGVTPRIEDGTWWIGDTDTAVPARGPKGLQGDALTLGTLVEEVEPGSGLYTVLREEIDIDGVSPTDLADALVGKANVSHVHNQADITGLTSALAGKAAAGHGHVIANVSGLQTTLDGKSNTDHQHITTDISDITAVGRGVVQASTAAAARAAIGAGTSSLVLGTTSTTAKRGDWKPDWSDDVTGKPDFAPATHTHAQDDVTGLAAALAEKAAAEHGHEIADVTGLGTELSGLSTAVAGKAATGHGHEIAGVSGLAEALDGKADSAMFEIVAELPEATDPETIYFVTGG